MPGTIFKQISQLTRPYIVLFYVFKDKKVTLPMINERRLFVCCRLISMWKDIEYLAGEAPILSKEIESFGPIVSVLMDVVLKKEPGQIFVIANIFQNDVS